MAPDALDAAARGRRRGRGAVQLRRLPRLRRQTASKSPSRARQRPFWLMPAALKCGRSFFLRTTEQRRRRQRSFVPGTAALAEALGWTEDPRTFTADAARKAAVAVWDGGRHAFTRACVFRERKSLPVGSGFGDEDETSQSNAAKGRKLAVQRRKDIRGKRRSIPGTAGRASTRSGAAAPRPRPSTSTTATSPSSRRCETRSAGSSRRLSAAAKSPGAS